MAKRRVGAWRDEAASSLAAEHLPRLGLAGPCLVMEDTRAEVGSALTDQGLDVAEWRRRAFGGFPATAWPQSGPFGTVALRLPKAKDELEMSAHAAAGVLEPGGRLLVYGAKDEGIGSAPRRIEPVFGQIRTVATGGRCRVLEATRPLVVADVRGTLDDWRTETELALPTLNRPWVSFPGVFAHGRLDPGTRLLVSKMPGLAPGSRVLDFACGSGVIGGALVARQADLTVTFLDVDAVALAAVDRNVRGAVTILSDGLAGAGKERYDAIVANPPYHRRTDRTLAVIRDLARESPAHLTSRGSLTLVVQKGLPVRGVLEETFADLETLAEDAAYRVLMAWAPRPPSRPGKSLPIYSKATARGAPGAPLQE